MFFCWSHGNDHFSNRVAETEGLTNPDFDILEAALKANHAAIIDLGVQLLHFVYPLLFFQWSSYWTQVLQRVWRSYCHCGTDKREKEQGYLCFIHGQRDERILGRVLSQLGCEFVCGEVGVSETGKEVTGSGPEMLHWGTNVTQMMLSTPHCKQNLAKSVPMAKLTVHLYIKKKNRLILKCRFRPHF